MLPKHLIEKIQDYVEKYKISDKNKTEITKRVGEFYNDAKIVPGEAIGVVTAESFGEPSTQMSEAFFEKVIIKIGNKIKIIEIGKFVDELIRLNGSLKLNDHSEVLPLNNLDVYVPSINQEEKVEWKKISEISRHKIDKKLLKLVTASGRKNVATDNHSFVTRINNVVVPIKGSNLKIGDRIPIINNFFTENCLEELKIDKYIDDENFVVDWEDNLHKIGTHPSKSIKNSIKLDWLTGWYIGAYLAEGSSNGGSVGISNIDDNYIYNAVSFADTIAINSVDRKCQGEYGLSRTLTIHSSILARFIITSCGNGSSHKYVPEFAYSASDQFVAGLLRGYFDGDGNFHVDRKMIRASSNSQELRDGIALLLSRFKIFSYKIKDNKDQYWLFIPYKYAPLYLNYISSDIEYKRKDLEKLAEKAKKFWNEYSREYTDMISGYGNLFWDVAKKLNYPSRYVNNFTKRQKIGRTSLYRYMKLFENLAKDKNIYIKEELALMSRMFNSDVIWDEIVSIEYVDYDYEYVYDFSVPGLETFTTFDGIITHNTLNTFHFAGVSEMNVTVGLPRLIEIFDARKKPSTPKMEIPLKAKYSKTIDMVREVAMKIKETKLSDVIQEISINIAKANVEIILDKKKLKELDLKSKFILDKLVESLKSVDIKETDTSIILKPKEKELALSEVYRLKEKAKAVHIRGLEGITHVLPVKNDDGNYVVHCAGSNLKEALLLEEADKENIRTNDIFEIGNVLGIEAARAAIIEDAHNVIKKEGIDIDVRHVMLLSDVMTRTGEIKGVTRTGITGQKESVLARASSETPDKHIINASLRGERDNLNSVVENVIINQPVPLGTGLPGLYIKLGKDDKH